MPSLFDGFMNLVAGLGAANPKQAGNAYVRQIGMAECEVAYDSSTWLSKIVDIPCDDATREWREWHGEEKDVSALERLEKTLNVRGNVRALIWSRLYGGSVILMGGLPGDPSTPVPASVPRGSLKWLAVFPRHEVSAGLIQRNPMLPGYNEPDMYTLSGGARVHPSRVIRFLPSNPTLTQMQADGWCSPIWARLADSVTTADSAASVIGALLIEAKTDVIKIPFIENLASSEFEELMRKRLQQMQVVKSATNVTLLDGSDEWDQKQISWSGLPETLNSLLIIMCGAADIPATRLLGTSASGLNATGEGDLKNYYDRVKSEQTLRIEPSLARLDEYLIQSALGGRPDDVWYSWRPLFQPTEKETAEVNKIHAETDQIYANMALVPERALAESVRNRMVNSGAYPGLSEALAAIPEAELYSEPSPGDLALLGDAAPRSLYVRRDVLNKQDVIKWARAAGYRDIMPDLHVTLVYIRQPVDWMAAGVGTGYDHSKERDPIKWSKSESEGDTGAMTIPAGGPRIVEIFGQGARVLSFASTDLSWRHRAILERTGGQHSYPRYQPHITISMSGPDPGTVRIEPYTGPIELGPEIFEEVRA